MNIGGAQANRNMPGGPVSGSGPAPAAENMGRIDGPQIDLGMGRRRVSGNDLFLYHALVRDNDQSITDLTELRPSDEVTLARYARQTRPPFVTEGPLDRLCARLNASASAIFRRARAWMSGWRRQAAPPFEAPHRTGSSVPSPSARGEPPRPWQSTPKRAA
jgi:hypothetical protein